MKVTIFDFLKLAEAKPDIANDLVQLAAKYEFECSDEVNDEDLPDFEQKGVWGYMHEHCFLVAVGDPQAIFAIEPATAA